VTEDEMVGWHLQFNGHEFEQIPGDCEGQGSLWGHKESNTTEQLSNNHQDGEHLPSRLLSLSTEGQGEHHQFLDFEPFTDCLVRLPQ